MGDSLACCGRADAPGQGAAGAGVDRDECDFRRFERVYDGPRAADEWTIGTGSATVNRGGVNILGGFGNLLIRPAEPVAA